MWSTLIWAWLSVAGTTAYLALFVSLHLLPTGYQPVRDAVSDYAVGRYRRLFRVGLWASSAGVLALAVALRVAVRSPSIATKDLLYLLLIPATRVAMTVFPTDLEGAHRSRAGVLHYVFAVAAFTFTYLVMSETTPALRTLGPATWLADVLRWTAAAVGPALALVVVTMLRPLRRVFGLFERIFLLTSNVWFLAVAALLVQRAS